MFHVTFTNRAQKEFSKLPKKVKVQLVAVIDGCQQDPWQFDYKKLQTPFPGFRIRSGVYRILFVVEGEVITVYSVSHRKDAYR